MLARDLGIKVVMTTHSPQLLMSIEANSAGSPGIARYYHIHHGDDGRVRIDDATRSIESIYQEMSDPIQETASRFWGLHFPSADRFVA